MIAFDIENTIRDRIAEDIQVHKLSARKLVVYMPFVYDDGDQCSIYVTKRAGKKWLLTDEGDACKRAGELGFDFDKETDLERLVLLTNLYGVTNNDGVLDMSADDDRLADSLFVLTQTCLETSWLAKTRKPAQRPEKKSFSRKFKRILQKNLDNARLEYNWHDVIRDEKRLYRVDCRAPGKEKQLFLFGIPNQSACMRATITCQHYRLAGADFEAVAIYDDEGALPKKTCDQLNEVVDKRFPRIAEKRSISAYLRLKAA